MPFFFIQYQGYESFSFLSALGSDVRPLKKYKAAVPYLNSSLTKALLYTFDEPLLSFETVEESSMSVNTLRTYGVPVVLDTPLCVYVWLPKKYWDKKKHKNGLTIAEVRHHLARQLLQSS